MDGFNGPARRVRRTCRYMEGKEKMSLRLWMPLMGDLRNQGLDNFSMSTLGTISWVDGKLGAKALQAGNANQTINGVSINSNLTDILADEYSVSVWVKPLGNHVHYNGTILSSGDWNHTRWSFGVNQDNTKVDVLSNRHNVYLNCTVPVNEWTHLVCTCDSSNRAHLYKNGEYIGYTTLSDKPLSDASNATIGRETYASGYFSFNGVIQDLRLYDHCLSEMEVKQLSQGLVLHYPLNRQGFGQENLLSAKYVQMSQWVDHGLSSATVTTDGYKNTYTLIKGIGGWESFYSDAITLAAGTYTFSCQYKTYTNFTPYSGAFGLRLTTSVPTSNDNSVTIATLGFSTTANDLTYISTVFTLSASTTIYVGINGGHISDGLENRVFDVNYIKLESGNLRTPWCPNSSDSLATTIGLNSTTEYDTSGYCNNGTRTGTFSWTSDTPKYSVSTQFGSGKQITGAVLPADALTAAIWIKDTGSLPSSAICFRDATSHLAMGIQSNNLICGASGGAQTAYIRNFSSNQTYKKGEWNHIVIIKNGNSYDIYINGIKQTLSSPSSQWSAGTPNDCLVVGGRGGSDYWPGQLSDLRIYATALSPSDVKSLYQNCATIDPDGTIRGQIRS